MAGIPTDIPTYFQISILHICILLLRSQHESILFGFPESSDNAIIINYCILYAKQYIYLEKLNDKKNLKKFNVDFLSYLSHLKNTLKIEKKHM